MLLVIDVALFLTVLALCFWWLVSRIWRRGDGLDIYGAYDKEQQK